MKVLRIDRKRMVRDYPLPREFRTLKSVVLYSNETLTCPEILQEENRRQRLQSVTFYQIQGGKHGLKLKLLPSPRGKHCLLVTYEEWARGAH